MRKAFMYLAMAAAATVLFVSCDDKKNDENTDPTIAEAVAGSYDVTCEIGMVPDGGMTIDPADATLKVTKVTDNTVKFEIADFKMGDTTIPIEVTSVELSGTNAKATVDYEGKIKYSAMEVDDATIEGSITPETKVVDLTVKFQLTQGEGEEAVTINYTITISEKEEAAE